MVSFDKIERKWQDRWEEKKIFEVRVKSNKKKCYVLEMFPYPSSSSLHMGHARNYCIGDCYARFKRMQGFNVLYPMGYDSFGLPAENAAIKANSHPKIFTESAIKLFMNQQKRLGLSYDWSRELSTHKADYYKWNQLLFLKFFDKGLVYRKKAPINWCVSCNTVLANEQVDQGKCWRCKNLVELKDLEQWFFKITDYADELLKDLEKLDGWPERIKIMQKNWIGKSRGSEINFRIKETNEIIPIFTTRADTLYGVTFMVFAPEHPLVEKWVKGTKYEKEFRKFLKEVREEDRFKRTDIETEKKGMFIGKYAINPASNEEIPVYIGNFVIYEYGAGAVMAVPAHDQRDFEFAKKFKIPIKVVISPEDYDLKAEKMSRAYVDDGILVNSGEFNGINNREAIEAITKYLDKKKLGKFKINYKLRDWLISRQRYWGTPIPIIYCDKCGIVKVPEKDLPVLLPSKVEFSGKGNPLEKNKDFVSVKCPKCGKIGRRETDTMDTFVDSSWYFLRYCDNKNNKEIFDKNKVKYWLPVDQYIGGAEHAVMHLLYARFFCKVLRDMKLVNFNEPFINLYNQGMVTKDGFVMSKSRGNVVDPNEIIKKYSADTLRLYLLFVAGPDKELEWSDKTIGGSFRFLNKVYNLMSKKIINKKDKKLENKINKTVKEVSDYISNFEMNKAVVSLMSFVDYLNSKDEISKDSLEVLSLILNPFCPHISEEIWSKIGNKGFASLASWPKYGKIDYSLEEEENLVLRTRDDINNILKLVKIKPKEVSLFVSSQWKYDLFKKLKTEVEKDRDIGRIMRNVMIKGKEKEISKIVPSVVKDMSKIPEVILDEKREMSVLKENLEKFEKEFNLKFKIEKDNGKAWPGKPGILVA